MNEPRDVVLASLSILALVALVTSGALAALKGWLQGVARNGVTGSGLPGSVPTFGLDRGGFAVPLTVGTGGDSISGQPFAGGPIVHLYGTYGSGGPFDIFTPDPSTGIGPFVPVRNQKYSGLPNTPAHWVNGWQSLPQVVIPDGVLLALAGKLGISAPAPSSPSSNRVGVPA